VNRQLGRTVEAAADAGEVVARWGGVTPEPPAVTLARRTLGALGASGRRSPSPDRRSPKAV
jgi:hypothetical protein